VPGQARCSSPPAPQPSAATRRACSPKSHQGRADEDRGQPGPPGEAWGRRTSFAQAAVLTPLRIPSGSQTILHSGRPAHLGRLRERGERSLARPSQALGGDGLRILTGTVTSPTVAAQVQGPLEKPIRRPALAPAGSQPEPTIPIRPAVRSFGPASLADSLRFLPSEGRGDASTPMRWPRARARCANAPPVLRTAGGVRKETLQKKEMNRLYAVESFPEPPPAPSPINRIQLSATASGGLSPSPSHRPLARRQTANGNGSNPPPIPRAPDLDACRGRRPQGQSPAPAW